MDEAAQFVLAVCLLLTRVQVNYCETLHFSQHLNFELRKYQPRNSQDNFPKHSRYCIKQVYGPDANGCGEETNHSQTLMTGEWRTSALGGGNKPPLQSGMQRHEMLCSRLTLEYREVRDIHKETLGLQRLLFSSWHSTCLTHPHETLLVTFGQKHRVDHVLSPLRKETYCPSLKTTCGSDYLETTPLRWRLFISE